jgi:hypothetical protein
MVQRRRGLRLALKSSESLKITGNVVRQELEGDITVKAGAFRFEDHPHAAAAVLAKPAKPSCRS